MRYFPHFTLSFFMPVHKIIRGKMVVSDGKKSAFLQTQGYRTSVLCGGQSRGYHSERALHDGPGGDGPKGQPGDRNRKAENLYENGLTNPFYGVSYDEYVEKILPTLLSYEHPVNMPEWFVPETYHYLWDEGHLVGGFRIRHYLTEALKTGAGHIGYSILKDVRCKGYGTERLRLTVQIAKDIIPEKEIYFCVNKDNIPSQKVMIKNGTRIAGEDENHLFMRIAK